MKGSVLVGKTIARVEQVRWTSNSGPEWILEAIHFTDGTCLRFAVSEGESEYAVLPIYPAKKGLGDDH
jgi:hypothetical protein